MTPFCEQAGSDGVLYYSTYLGGGKPQPYPAHNYDDAGYAIALDSDGNAYVVGTTSSSDFPTTISITSRTPDYGEAFLAKFGTDGL